MTPDGYQVISGGINALMKWKFGILWNDDRNHFFMSFYYWFTTKSEGELVQKIPLVIQYWMRDPEDEAWEVQLCHAERAIPDRASFSEVVPMLDGFQNRDYDKIPFHKFYASTEQEKLYLEEWMTRHRDRLTDVIALVKQEGGGIEGLSIYLHGGGLSLDNGSGGGLTIE
jgi:hypothetical protein